MLPYFTDKFGNASSRHHSFGWTAKDAVENARAQVASLIGAGANEIVFTSGATESNNLAIRGVAEAHRTKGNHIVSCVSEHRAVIDTCRKLETEGLRVTYLPVGADGRIDLDELHAAITGQTILVTVMAANNEIGVLQPLASIGAVAMEREVVFHTDATQAVGKVPFDVSEIQAGLASFSAHKIYGPKGIGALYVRRRKPRVLLTEQISGGGHERGLRSGTLNTPGIVGFGAAAAICREEMAAESARIRQLRDRLDRLLRESLVGMRVNGSMEHRLPSNLNVSFFDVDGDALLMAIDDVALSSGAACTSADRAPSHVLRSLGLDEELARASLRFGLGRWTTEAEIDYVAKKVTNVVRHLRKISPLQPLYAEG
jgi:cysteine desulfurase